jgi:hypothetical protein
MGRGRTPAPQYRYARRLIIEAGQQSPPPRLTLLAGSALAQYQLTAPVGYQLADIVRYLLTDAVGYELADIVRYLVADAVGFGLRIPWQVTPVPAARRLTGPAYVARRHHHRGCERQRQGDEHPQYQDYFMEELRVDHLSPRSDLFTPFTETIISCLS